MNVPGGEPWLNTLVYGRAVATGDSRIAFCHGLFGQGRNWSTVGRGLADSGWLVALPDLPNHGRSGWTDPVDYGQMAEAVAGEFHRLGGASRWALVGHSMGGKVAMRLALDHPDLVERLCVVDIAPAAQPEPSPFARYVEAMRSVDLDRLTGRERADAQLTDAVPDPAVRAFLLQNLRRYPADGGRWRWQMNLAVLGDQLDRVGGWPEPTNRPYPGPVLWVAGARSDYVRPEHGPVMRALFPQARLVTVKNAGHWVHSEQPEVFSSILRSFLAAEPTR